MVKEIPLDKGMVALVDDEDYERVARYKWYAFYTSGQWYARTNRWVIHNGQRKCISYVMHRFILNAQPGQEIDHINRNGLDNRRENLRIVPRSVNAQNRRAWGESRFKGVTKASAKTWVARAKRREVEYRLGTYRSEVAAALAYDYATSLLYSEGAATNFPVVDDLDLYYDLAPSFIVADAVLLESDGHPPLVAMPLETLLRLTCTSKKPLSLAAFQRMVQGGERR